MDGIIILRNLYPFGWVITVEQNRIVIKSVGINLTETWERESTVRSTVVVHTLFQLALNVSRVDKEEEWVQIYDSQGHFS